MSKKILIVDDEKDVLELIRKRLDSAGFVTEIATDGEQGFKKAKEFNPDLIITDIVMPVMDGFALYKALRQEEGMASIPILVLSGRRKMEDSFRALGAEYFVSKPFEAQDLVSKVSQILNQETNPQIDKQPLEKKTFSGKKILIAGSSKTALSIMRDQLESQGHLVEWVLDGPHTITKSVEFLPDIIILDINLQEVSIAEVIKTLRYLPVVKARPILVFNSQEASSNRDASGMENVASTEQAVEDCHQAGASQYIGAFKEFSFLKTISKYL